MNTLTKVILVCLLLLGKVSFAQTTPLTYSVIPTTATDLQRPGAGANEWSYDQNIVNIPVQGTNTQRLDRYWRFTWLDFQAKGAASGSYDFTVLDQKIQQSINKQQGFSFGVMQQCTGCDINLQNPIGGKTNLLPNYIINNITSWAVGNDLYFNYNDPIYLNALRNLNIAINAHILASSWMGVAFKTVIDFIDIRGYGNYGEWTNNSFAGPGGTTATVATLDSIQAYYFRPFNTFQMVTMIATFDGNQLSNTQVAPAVGFFALMSSNAKGKFGWRRDNWGQVDNYIHQWLDQNNTSFGGIVFKDSIMARFKYAPIVGEPQDGGSETNFSNLAAQGTQYGGNSFGNGNLNNGDNATIDNNFRLASKTFGYRLNLNAGGSVTGSRAGGPFQIVQHWRNVGASPTYLNWNCTYDLRTGPTAAPVWTGTSSFNPYLLSPAGADNVVTDNFTLTSVPAGTYELHMTMKDPLGYRFPMPIYITNTQQADGSYIILTNIVIGTGGPVANAGPNQSIIISSASLSGSSSTGTISSYLWTQISGPNTATITTPTTVGTTVTGLITGTYIFQLAINGGSSGSLIDQVQIIVNAPVLQANAGNNQTITLPTSTVSLSGSGSTGVITSYLWSQVSGPNVPTITTPTTVNTTVTGLIAGTYVFDLSINGGASHSQVTIKVLPAPLPIANAGVSQTIALPTSSVSVSGSGSSGNITSYAWSMLSGPNAAVFGTPTTVGTTITGLIQGVYLIQLALNGGTATDTMRVTVNAAAPPIPSGQTIFTTQVSAGFPNGTLNDGNQGGLTGIELGMKFRSSVNGFILGVRYLKTIQQNSGIKIGELYSYPGGARLAAATFVNEGVSGWQSVVFSSPVEIVAGTTYIVAYFSPNGNYISSTGQMNTAIVNGNLTALADGTDGPNGVYRYSNSPIFPNSNFQKSNYWVDVIFASPNTNSCNCHSFPKFEKTKVLNGF